MNTQGSEFEPTLNLMASYNIYKRTYNMSMNEEDFIEEAYIAFKEINSIPVEYFYTVQKPNNEEEMLIEVPCNMYRVVSVTSDITHADDFQDIKPYKVKAYNYRDGGEEYLNNLYGGSDLKTYHFNSAPNTGIGTYVHYSFESESKIKLADKRLVDKQIHLVYEGIRTDDDGLPMITRKHAKAIAAKVALINATRKMFSGDPTMANVLPFLQGEVGRLVQAAAIPEHLTDNQLDKMLDVKTSFDRKGYNRGMKFNR